MENRTTSSEIEGHKKFVFYFPEARKLAERGPTPASYAAATANQFRNSQDWQQRSFQHSSPRKRLQLEGHSISKYRKPDQTQSNDESSQEEEEPSQDTVYTPSGQKDMQNENEISYVNYETEEEDKSTNLTEEMEFDTVKTKQTLKDKKTNGKRKVYTNEEQLTKY